MLRQPCFRRKQVGNTLASFPTEEEKPPRLCGPRRRERRTLSGAQLRQTFRTARPLRTRLVEAIGEFNPSARRQKARASPHAEDRRNKEVQKRGDVGLVHVFSALDGADLVGEAGAAAFVDFPALECQNALRERGRVAGAGVPVLPAAMGIMRLGRGRNQNNIC